MFLVVVVVFAGIALSAVSRRIDVVRRRPYDNNYAPGTWAAGASGGSDSGGGSSGGGRGGGTG